MTHQIPDNVSDVNLLRMIKNPEREMMKAKGCTEVNDEKK
jgi:hypothetical protein